MMMFEFECSQCGLIFEDLVQKDETIVPCKKCEAFSNRILSAPRVGLYNDPNRRAEELRDRATKHQQREAAKNPEMIAAKTGGKPKAQTPWNARSQKITKKKKSK